MVLSQSFWPPTASGPPTASAGAGGLAFATPPQGGSDGQIEN